MAKRNRHEHAWGLMLDGGKALLVRVTREAERFVIDRISQGDLHTVGAGLDRIPADEPLAACIGDEAVLYRRLELPDAQPHVLEEMVRAQAEAAMPLPIEMMAWGWGEVPATGEGKAVLLCAARRDGVTLTNIPLLARLPQPERVTTRGLASSVAAAATLGIAPEERVVVVTAGAQATTLSLVTSRGVQHCAVVDQGADDLSEAADQAHRMWIDGVDRAYHQCLHATGGPLPKGLLVIGEGGGCSDAAASLAQALGLPLIDVREARVALNSHPSEVAVQESRDTPEQDLSQLWPALGAALYRLTSPTPAITLHQTDADPTEEDRPRRLRRIAAAAVLIVLAVLCLYWMDLRQADRLEAQVAALKAEVARTGGAKQALKLGQYLQEQPLPPLLALQAVSASASDRASLKQWQYDGRGQLQFGGEVRGVNELDKTLVGLTNSPAFQSVELRTANVNRDHWTFQINLAMRPLNQYIARAAMADGGLPMADGKKSEATPTHPSNKLHIETTPSAIRHPPSTMRGGQP